MSRGQRSAKSRRRGGFARSRLRGRSEGAGFLGIKAAFRKKVAEEAAEAEISGLSHAFLIHLLDVVRDACVVDDLVLIVEVLDCYLMPSRIEGEVLVNVRASIPAELTAVIQTCIWLMGSDSLAWATICTVVPLMV